MSGLQRYRAVLAIPGVAQSIVLVFIARLPLTAMALTLTLHVVTDLHQDYVAAGLVGTATTVGTMLGAPAVGRALDRHGLRRVLLVCGTAATVYWLSIPWLSYPALLVAALPAGALVVPVTPISRQVLSALVPTEQRRTAFSIDNISVEMSFIIGPAVAVYLLTQVSGRVTLLAIGTVVGLVSILLYVRNPPLRNNREVVEPAAQGSRWGWFSSPLLATLLLTAGALFVLGGTEIALVAALRATGDVSWTGIVISLMAVASIFGGLVHGAVHKSLPQLVLMVLLAGLTIPAGLVHQPWWLLGLALVPMQLVCAPTLAATTESVSRFAPPDARGVAMGLQDSATRLGAALSSPVVGFVVDSSSPAWGFVASGVGGLLLAAVAVPLLRGTRDSHSVSVQSAA